MRTVTSYKIHTTSVV